MNLKYSVPGTCEICPVCLEPMFLASKLFSQNGASVHLACRINDSVDFCDWLDSLEYLLIPSNYLVPRSMSIN